MESRTKIFGHPLHPMLVVFPLGLLIVALLFDIAWLVTDRPRYAMLAYYNIFGGIVGGLLAAIFGFRDWLSIPRNTRARRIGALHGLGNLAVMVLFIVNWSLRFEDPAHIPSAAAIALSFVGIGLAGFTGWLGGELVDRLGVGVDEGANLDAPSSLTNRSATTRGPVPH